MVLNDDKINHLAHLLVQGLQKDPEVKLALQAHEVLREVKRLIIGELKLDDEIDVTVRRKLSSYSRKISEGSPEWDVLYRKNFEEEMRKRRR